MPPPPLPSDANTQRDSGYSGMGARWNDSQDEFAHGDDMEAEDEHEDVISLYQRDNWPLVDSTERSVSPDTVVSVDSEARSISPDEREEHRPELRKSEEAEQDMPEDLEGRDVSDVEEDSDESDIDKTPSSASNSPDLDTESTSAGAVDRNREHMQDHTRDDAGDVSPVEPAESAFLPVQGTETQTTQHSDEDDDEQEESRDVYTAMEFSQDDTRTISSIPSSPPAYGRSTPTTNGSIRPSSIAKGTPPSRSTSRRSQHITPLRDRVRYSWQSVQDEEPNRPRIHIIKLISNSATASAGFPQGEAFGFSMSPGGRRIAAFNSARLYILQTAALPVGISQDFALKRRPLAVEVVDDGNMLAILAEEHTINIYDLGHQQLRRIQTIKTDFPTSCIALSPTGALLAAAYEGGVEIFSLAQGALPTDRRAVRCPKMDRLRFSEDSSTLLGTTVRINVSSTMAVSVPVFPASVSGIPSHEELKEAWCSELLHPENIRNSSHAVFMRELPETTNDKLFAWNGLEDTFGILNISDMQYGPIEFPVVISPPLSTCGGLGAAIHSPPAVDEHGNTVAMIVNDRTIRLYIVPRRSDDDETPVEAHSIDHELDEGYGCPFTEVRWVYTANSLFAPRPNQPLVKGRLVVASPGGIADPTINEEPVDDIEGGRIILFDFDAQFAGQAGQTFSLTLGKSQPQLLEEPAIDVAEEVALVRRRTVNQSRGGGLSTRPITLGRTASTFGRRNERSPRSGSALSRPIRNSLLSMSSEATRSLPDLMESSEVLDTFEEPYAQGAPRSHASLQRAASNAQRHRFQTLEERNQERVTAEATDGFLPLPEYTEEPNAPLPSRFRALAGLDQPALGPAKKPALITSPDGDRMSPGPSTPLTAPAVIGSSSAEQAFRPATAQSERARGTQRSPSTPPNSFEPGMTRSSTFDSLSSLPRSLRRAYTNAPQASNTGEWQPVSPATSINQGRQFPPLSHISTMRSGTLANGVNTLPEDGTWEGTSPMAMRRHNTSSPFGLHDGSAYRHSTSQLNPPGHSSPIRSPTSMSSFDAANESPTSTISSRTRRLPPHIVAMRSAASASASIFPPNQPADHVPVREPSSSNIGSVPHPVTAWHPPAPSIASGAHGSMVRGHSRVSSSSNRSAFASTAKAKKLGFFRSGTTKKRKNQALYGPEFTPGNAPPKRGGESVFETKSIFTTFTRGEGRCTVM